MPKSLSDLLFRNKKPETHLSHTDDDPDDEYLDSGKKLICLSNKNILFIGNKGLFNKNSPLSSKQAFFRAGRLGMGGIECELWESGHDENDRFKLIVTKSQLIADKDGIQRDVSLLTPRQLKEYYPKPKNGTDQIFEICSFRKFLVICSLYDIIPFVIIKQKNLSKRALARIFKLLDITQNINKVFILSNRIRVLERFKRYSSSHHYDNVRYMLNYAENSNLYEANGLSSISKLASENNYTGIRIPKERLTKELYDDCIASGLLIDIFTFKRSESDMLAETIDKYPQLFGVELRVRL